jgi:hypothetical protein
MPQPETLQGDESSLGAGEEGHQDNAEYQQDYINSIY